MTKAELRRKPKKTLVLMATLRRVYKGGKKQALKESKDSLVNALATKSKVSGLTSTQKKALDTFARTGKYKGVAYKNYFTLARKLGTSVAMISSYYRTNKTKAKVSGTKRKATRSVGRRKFGIDVKSAKDITEINKKIKAKIQKGGSYDTIKKALAESRYLYVLSFSPAWKKDLKNKLMSVRRRAKSNYCSLVPVANKRLKEKGIVDVLFTKICKR